MQYRITLLSMGSSEVPGPELFWMGEWDKWFRLQFQVALIQGNGITALINTGPARDLTVSNVLEFPRATIYISKRGWLHFHSTHGHPHDNRNASIPPEILKELVTNAWDRLHLLEDEETVAPGIRCWWSGGHHRASFAVEVDTVKGVAVLSDTFFYLENVQKNHPIGISENIYESMTAYARAAKADIILPLYDPKNFERFEDGVVT
jgi:hypothetical protein